ASRELSVTGRASPGSKSSPLKRAESLAWPSVLGAESRGCVVDASSGIGGPGDSSAPPLPQASAPQAHIDQTNAAPLRFRTPLRGRWYHVGPGLPEGLAPTTRRVHPAVLKSASPCSRRDRQFRFARRGAVSAAALF